MIDLASLEATIKENRNFVFVKRGDGEQACMEGQVGQNCDGHPYTTSLGDALRDAYAYLKDKAIIVEFADQVNYNVLLHRTDSDLAKVSHFYKTIANSERLKVMVAPERLAIVARLLNAEHVVVPDIDAWSQVNEIFDRIPKIRNAVYMFCAGMPAKVLIARMLEQLSDATYIDCGSAFDPAIYTTRTYQITQTVFWKLYE